MSRLDAFVLEGDRCGQPACGRQEFRKVVSVIGGHVKYHEQRCIKIGGQDGSQALQRLQAAGGHRAQIHLLPSSGLPQLNMPLAADPDTTAHSAKGARRVRRSDGTAEIR
jgi:hypothetical protein